MPKRSRKVAKKRAPVRDENQSAFDAVQRIIELTEGGAVTKDGKDPMAVALGRRGGLKGGPARAAKLTKAQRKAGAALAARERWRQYREGQK
jgi:hypothetical protein